MKPFKQTREHDNVADWLKTLHQNAHSDIRWAKEQGWKVVNWTLALLGGLLASQNQLHIPYCSVIAVGVVLVVTAAFYLYDLHSAAKVARQLSQCIEEKSPITIKRILAKTKLGKTGVISENKSLIENVRACLINTRKRICADVKAYCRYDGCSGNNNHRTYLLVQLCTCAIALVFFICTAILNK